MQDWPSPAWTTTSETTGRPRPRSGTCSNGTTVRAGSRASIHCDALSYLASTAQYDGREEEAEELYLEVHGILRGALRRGGHPDPGGSLASLGILYVISGRAEDADRVLREALETAERALGPDHSEHLARAARQLAVARGP